jgi:hypothetical protein
MLGVRRQSRMHAATRLWLVRGKKRIKEFNNERRMTIEGHERYWSLHLRRKIGRIKYDQGQLVFHIHGTASADVYLPIALQKKMSDLNIAIRYVFWGK